MPSTHGKTRILALGRGISIILKEDKTVPAHPHTPPLLSGVKRVSDRIGPNPLDKHRDAAPWQATPA